jgi:hypothetical protein
MDVSLFRNRRSESESVPNGCRWIECALHVVGVGGLMKRGEGVFTRVSRTFLTCRKVETIFFYE